MEGVGVVGVGDIVDVMDQSSADMKPERRRIRIAVNAMASAKSTRATTLAAPVSNRWNPRL
jgi:hypothetical protein